MTVVDDVTAVPRFARGRRQPKKVSAYSQMTEAEKERKRNDARRHRARDPERTRRQWREYRERRMVEAGATPKPECCEVCGNGGKINADHNHETGMFRGWLCTDCNLTLGKMIDDPARLRALADYLEAHNDGVC